MDEEAIRKIIQEFGKASDAQLSTPLARECQEFEGQDVFRFLRDLRDKCVRYGGGSPFVMATLELLLKDAPDESDAERDERHRQIEAAERRPST